MFDNNDNNNLDNNVANNSFGNSSAYINQSDNTGNSVDTSVSDYNAGTTNNSSVYINGMSSTDMNNSNAASLNNTNYGAYNNQEASGYNNASAIGNSDNTFGSTNSPYTTYNFTSYQNNEPVKKQWPKPKKEKKEKSLFKKIVSIIGAAVLFGVVAGGAFSVPTYIANKQLLKNKAAFEQEVAAAKSSLATTTSQLSTSNSTAPTSAVSDIAANCLPSVVSITNKGITEVRTFFGTYRQDSQSSGSGIIIGENETELLIVTNYHVVSGSNELSVIFSYDEDSENPSVISAKIKGYDEDKDLAVIAVSSKDITTEMRNKIKVATIGDSSKLSLGQEVVAIGNALGYGQSVTRGIISALNREVTVSDENGSTITNKLIQTDAAINPGNSGGALLNMNGELIGINSVKVASSQVEGMGYAIPISDVQSIIEELMLIQTREAVPSDEQGYLGISGIDVTNEMITKYDMPAGVYVSTIYENSPAANAGITKGMIISKVDGQTVKTMSQLQNLMTYYRAGENVNVVVNVLGNDGYEQKTLTLTLGDKKIFGDTQNSTPQQEDNKSNNPSDGYDGYNYGTPWDGYNFFWPFGTP